MGSKAKVHVAIFVGTRPEVIKMAPVHSEFSRVSQIRTSLISSNQHSSLLAQALSEFDLKPDFEFDSFRYGQSLDELSGKLLLGACSLLDDLKPDAILVHGDTSTAAFSAMAGFYKGVPVAHVEAGLRTQDLRSPFPEEFNRQLIGRVASWNFAPDEQARQNLLRENVQDSTVFVVGNTIVDSLQLALGSTAASTENSQSVELISGGLLPRAELREVVLLTFHRRENLPELEQIFAGLVKAAVVRRDLTFVFPVHPNPAVRDVARASFSGCSNVHLVEPLSYRTFVNFLNASVAVITDSGGIQEEAVTLGIPALVVRRNSERLSGFEESASLGSLDAWNLSREVLKILARDNSRKRVTSSRFGDGRASQRIVKVISENFFETFT